MALSEEERKERQRAYDRKRAELRRSDPEWKAKKAAYNKAYAEANSARIKEQQAGYREANREKINARELNRYYNNREVKQAYNREYYRRNREKLNAASRAYHYANRDVLIEAMKAKRRADPERFREMARRSYHKHRARRLEDMKRWRLADPERHRDNAKRWQEINPERFKANLKAWRERNPTYTADRSRTNVDFRLGRILRVRLLCAIRRVKATKDADTIALTGCTVAELRAHLEAQFVPGMTWENHTPDGWHIDHKRPLCTFDLTDPDQQRAAFHYTNLRPLWAVDNLRRSKRFIPEAA